jgi:hypothetical protein
VIYQLMKLDHTWKATRIALPIYTIIAILSTRWAASCFPSVLREATDSEFFGIAMFLTFFPVLVCQPHLRSYPYLITLPVSSRQLYLARTISILTLLWAPAIISTILFAFLGPKETTAAYRLLLISGSSTFIVSLIQTIRPKEFAAPLSSLLLMMVLSLWWSAGHLFPILTVVYFSLGASALLFSWNWLQLPSSFELMSSHQFLKTASPNYIVAYPGINPDCVRPSAMKPILQSIFSLYYCFMFLALFVQIMVGLFSAIPLFFTAGWIFSRHRLRWLYALPFSFNRILLLLNVPLFICLSISYFLNNAMFRITHPFHIRILGLVAIFDISLLSLLCMQLFRWHKFHWLSDSFRLIAEGVFYLLFILGIVVPLFSLGHSQIGWLLFFLSRSLPDNRLLLAFLSLISLAGLYWINLKLFREAEYIEIRNRVTEIEARRIYAG